jgi:D-sedoheptulose 7-phosphate isomerase
MSIPSFPLERYERASDYLSAYLKLLAAVGDSLNPASLNRAADLLEKAILSKKTIYVCGNGGSAAIANHLCCDFGKGVTQGTSFRPKVVSLAAEMATFSAIANDIGYTEVFAFQLKNVLEPGDLVLAISSSGNSPNILRALEVAKEKGNASILLAGFSGGKGAEQADVVVHYPAKNYGIVEDLHQATMHVLAQFLRMRGLPADAKVVNVVF